MATRLWAFPTRNIPVILYSAYQHVREETGLGPAPLLVMWFLRVPLRWRWARVRSGCLSLLHLLPFLRVFLLHLLRLLLMPLLHLLLPLFVHALLLFFLRGLLLLFGHWLLLFCLSGLLLLIFRVLLFLSLL